MKRVRILTLGVSFFFALWLIGCESDTSYEVEDLPEKVAGVADLPDCDDNYEGDEVFVEELSRAFPSSFSRMRIPIAMMRRSGGLPIPL